MNYEGIKKLILRTAGAAAAVGVAVMAAVEYRAGWDFTPVASDHALNENQIVFQDGDKAANKQQESDGDSELWQKDNASDEETAPRKNEQADYLFEDTSTADNGMTQGGSENAEQGRIDNGLQQVDTRTVNINAGQTTSVGGAAGTVYDMTGDAANADLIISGGSGLNGGSGSGTSAAGSPSSAPGPEPRPTAVPGNTAAPTPGTATPTPSVQPAPTVRPSESAADPVIPDGSTGGGIPFVEFDEEKVNEIQEEDRQVFLSVGMDESNAFYTGQKLTLQTIFGLLQMGITDTKEQTFYIWKWEQYGTYVRIDRITFDGGKTWTEAEELPVTIPADAGKNGFNVEVSYRLKATDSWSTGTVDNITVSESRVLVLDRAVSAGTTVLDNAWVLTSSSGEQYPAVGTKQSLYGYLGNYWQQAPGSTAAGKYLPGLLPGWTEKGVLLPWFFTVETGRHVLEPAAVVPLDTSLYGVELKHYWITTDYVATRSGEGLYGNLQTLTYYAGADARDADGAEYQEHLAVPQYIQAVDMPYYPYLSVGCLELPDTVIFVNTDGVTDSAEGGCGLQVTKGYTVADGNPRYTAQDGLLYDKAGTEILGVPAGRTELTVEKNITAVHLPYRSSLTGLTLAAEDMDSLPDINYAQMAPGGTIYLHAAMLDDFLVSQRAVLNGKNIYVSAIEEPARRYAVQDNLAVTEDGRVYRALESSVRQLKLPNSITALGKESLQYLLTVDLLMLPEDGHVIALEDGWADGLTLDRIGCYTQEQYLAAMAAAPDGVEVVMLHAVDGYYYTNTNGWLELISAPADVTAFDGRIPAGNGETLVVNAIDDGAFRGCISLVWVDLPQETTFIGYQAFAGCTGLQGVLIGTQDPIQIGDLAFDGCDSLRFVASNALYGDILDENFSLETIGGNGLLYRPTEADGYNDNWIAFTPESGVTGYKLVDCGGTRVLYGLDADGDPWLMLRSGAAVDGALKLPEQTVEIFVEAARGARAADGGMFSVNWDDLRSLEYIDGSAFAESDIGAAMTLPADIALGDSAFAACSKLTEVTMPSVWPGIALSRDVFSECVNLTRLTLGEIRYGSSLYAGMLNSCTGGANGHIDIYFEGSSAPDMVSYGGRMKFYFNAIDWFGDEREAEHISVHVPEEYQQAYLKKWRYTLMAYSAEESDRQSAYQILWDDILLDMIWDGGQLPADAEVMAEADKRLTDSENRARTLMGLPETDSFRQYALAVDPDTGIITLTGARGIQGTDLTARTMEMPDDWTLDIIDSGAFRDSPDLSVVSLPVSLCEIRSGAFEGVHAEFGLMLMYMPGNSCALTGFAEGTPFDFGVADEDITLIDCAWDGEGREDYIQNWTLPLAGYSSYEGLYAAKAAELTAQDGTAPAQDAVMAAVRQALLYGENRVRTLLKMELLTDADELTFVIPDGGTGAEELPENAAVFALRTPETALTAGAGPEEEPAPAPAQSPETIQPATASTETPQLAPAPAAELTPADPATPETAAEPENPGYPEYEE